MGTDRNIGHADLLISRMHLGMDPIPLYGVAMRTGDNLVKVICYSPEDQSLDTLQNEIPLSTVRGICALRNMGHNITYFCVVQALKPLPGGEQDVVELTLKLEPISPPPDSRVS